MATSSVIQTLPKVNIGQVLERLQHVRKTSRGWTALCPAHPDRNPSLSIAVGKDGRILLYCWSGCTYREIVVAMGFAPSDLSPGRLRPCTPEERRQAAEQARQREQERALKAWADKAYTKLVPLRRACFLLLDTPDSYYCTLMDYCDHVLNELQYGDLADKLVVMRMARADRLGLAGAVMSL